MATARAISFYPSFSVLAEAEVINEELGVVDRHLTLAGVIHEAMEVNLDLQASNRKVAGGEQEIRRARAMLLPQVDVSATGLSIDSDRAAASFGTQPERTLSAGTSVSQLLYSERALANVDIQKMVQLARELERETLRLDIALEAAVAYLNVLRAKALERIEKDNLRVTRTNRELARVRKEIGLGSPAEEYRWESLLSISSKAVLDATANRQLAERQLNRSLDRPLEEPFATAETDVFDPALCTAGGRIFDFTDNPLAFKVFRDFMTMEALDNSPELKAMDEAIATQERALKSARRAFWSPTVAIKAALEHRLAAGGAGIEGLDMSFLSLPIEFPQPNKTNWNIALSASLPIFSGGAMRADLTQAYEELGRLRTERRAIADRIAQRVRTAIQLGGASYTAIGLSQKAAEAARNNLELVTDAYSRGVVSIVELLDAQNADLVAGQAEATAVYNFLTNVLKFERAYGRFFALMSDEEKEALFKRLKGFFKEAGVADSIKPQNGERRNDE